MDKVRVTRFVARGYAPSDPRLATATIELAESYQQQRRLYAVFGRWTPVFTAVVLGALTIPAAISGDVLMAIGAVVVVLGCVVFLWLDPAARPRSVARSLNAAKLGAERYPEA